MDTYYFRLFYWFKLLKVSTLPRISEDIRAVFAALKARFLRERFMIDNTLELASLFFFLLFIIHFVACSWIRLGMADKGWVHELSDDITKEHELLHEIYFNSIYFITTTMTTVGYGDISANTDGQKVEKFFMCFVEFFGIAVFTMI